MVGQHPAKFGSHWHWGSGDIIFLVSEEENSRCSGFNPPFLFVSKGHGLKAAIGQRFVNNFCQSVKKH